MTPAAYDAWYDSPRGRWIGETEFALLAGLLDPVPGETLLDVGCGTGWFTRRFPVLGLAASGLDNDPARLAYAGARDPAGRYLQGDARALPFPEAAFDVAVSVTALCFVADWRSALAEMVRVARRRVVLGLLNRHSLLWLAKGRGGGQGAYRGAHWHTAGEVRAALAGLPVAAVRSRSAIFLPSATPAARVMEHWLPGRWPLGGFLAVAADVSR